MFAALVLLLGEVRAIVAQYPNWGPGNLGNDIVTPKAPWGPGNDIKDDIDYVVPPPNWGPGNDISIKDDIGVPGNIGVMDVKVDIDGVAPMDPPPNWGPDSLVKDDIMPNIPRGFNLGDDIVPDKPGVSPSPATSDMMAECPCRATRKCLDCEDLKQCPGGENSPSNATVFGGPGQCKTPCRWSTAEGFSFCDTLQLFWREERWNDWDLCSLCDGEGKMVTPHGDECSEEEAGKCTRRWNDFEVDGPRCRNTEGNLQWCSTCHSDHPDTSAEDCSTYKLGTAVGGDYGLWQNPEA